MGELKFKNSKASLCLRYKGGLSITGLVLLFVSPIVFATDYGQAVEDCNGYSGTDSEVDECQEELLRDYLDDYVALGGTLPTATAYGAMPETDEMYNIIWSDNLDTWTYRNGNLVFSFIEEIGNPSQDSNLPMCTNPESNVQQGFVSTRISFFEAYFGANGLSADTWHEIAEEAQETYDNNISYSGPLGFVLTVHTFISIPSEVFGFTMPGISLSGVAIYGNSSLSLYENIMNEMDLTPNQDALEEYECQ